MRMDEPLSTTFPSLRTLVVVFAYNEGVKLDRTLGRFPIERDYDLMVMDDGSSDGSTQRALSNGFDVLRNEANQGIGAAMRRAIGQARTKNYDVIVMFAGNDKDRPEDIPALLEPIRRGGSDIVQGSRYLPGGRYGNMPRYRRFATQYVHPLLFSLAAGRRMTDTTNGFRAIRLSLFDDPNINLNQSWMRRYELEPYLLYQAIRLGYGVREVPVTKIYPPHDLGYTKMRPVTGWWSILRPVFLLGLRLRS